MLCFMSISPAGEGMGLCVVSPAMEHNRYFISRYVNKWMNGSISLRALFSDRIPTCPFDYSLIFEMTFHYNEILQLNPQRAHLHGPVAQDSNRGKVCPVENPKAHCRRSYLQQDSSRSRPLIMGLWTLKAIVHHGEGLRVACLSNYAGWFYCQPWEREPPVLSYTKPKGSYPTCKFFNSMLNDSS